MKVLILDDEPLARQLLDQYLSLYGFSIRTCATVSAAADIASDFQPDILVADWVLSGETGLDGANAVMERSPSTQVIFATGLPVEMLPSQAQDISFEILSKPLDLDLLVDTLKRTGQALPHAS